MRAYSRSVDSVFLKPCAHFKAPTIFPTQGSLIYECRGRTLLVRQLSDLPTVNLVNNAQPAKPCEDYSLQGGGVTAGMHALTLSDVQTGELRWWNDTLRPGHLLHSHLVLLYFFAWDGC